MGWGRQWCFRLVQAHAQNGGAEPRLKNGLGIELAREEERLVRQTQDTKWVVNLAAAQQLALSS
ncbi:hypothetical protein ACFRFL_37130 [Streptomyces sp. NPDC056708]|uniref:hypothetical protein n=1 Tax=unclassified Streptomyces TaxID=2593676 RepID=UPI0036A8423C